MNNDNIQQLATTLINSDKKSTLIYAFNGSGKTRLSMEFIEEVNKGKYDKVLYFNAFTEDLFNWDNSYGENGEKILLIDKYSKFVSILKDSGKNNEIIRRFKYYTNSKIEPIINLETGEISFNLPTGDDNSISNIKVSRGEESVFIWSTFYVLVEEIIEQYNQDDDDTLLPETNYIFIDDPVSSLDDGHLINIALDVSELISSSESRELRFFITTHHPLFYNVLHNKIGNSQKYTLKKSDNDNESAFSFQEQKAQSPVAYHIEIKKMIDKAIEEDCIQKYHFILLRNLLEKTATFLGYKNWKECIRDENNEKYDSDSYGRIINIHSHSSLSTDEYKDLPDHEKALFKMIFQNFIINFNWCEVNGDED